MYVKSIVVSLHCKQKQIDMKFFEIKNGKNWELVQASSMMAINKFCKNNGYTDWRMCGMMSRTELENNKKTAPVVG